MIPTHRTPLAGPGREIAPETRPAYDPDCYLCPGNERAGGHRNPDYTATFAFDNDFAALLPKDPSGCASPYDGLLVAEAEGGICRVVCFSSRHHLTLPRMSCRSSWPCVDTWTEETRLLGARAGIQSVQIFENHGEMMGCSNPHPHSQIWATEHLPNESAKELARQGSYFEHSGRPLLADVLAAELRDGQRIVVENQGFVALVPFWAAWPFETLIVPRQPLRTLLDLDGEDRRLLAGLLKVLTTRYDNLFETSFPYSMGFHQAPFDGALHPEWILHAHFYPPLLRGATVRKFMVGFEMLGMPGRDITPEHAAARLRAVAEVHYAARPTQGC